MNNQYAKNKIEQARIAELEAQVEAEKRYAQALDNSLSHEQQKAIALQAENNRIMRLVEHAFQVLCFPDSYLSDTEAKELLRQVLQSPEKQPESPTYCANCGKKLGESSAVSDFVDGQFCSASCVGEYESERNVPNENPAQALEAPKNPIAQRCRVDWNKRGFSSGDYAILGYSNEKQVYVIEISTDPNVTMPKTVKMTDCEISQ